MPRNAQKTSTKSASRKKIVAAEIEEVIEPVVEKKESAGSKYILGTVVVIMLLVLYWYKTNTWPIAAVVNYRPIFRFQLDQQMYSQIGSSTLDSMIVEQLIKDDVAAKKITVNPADVDAKISSIKTQLGSEDSFKSALSAQGLTESRLREQIGIQLALQKMVAGDATDSAQVQTKIYDYLTNIRDGKKIWVVTSEQK